MNLTDFHIQKQIQGGDIREFERLFTKYYGPLCHHANKILKDMDLSEDVVQEFFYQLWKNRERFSLKLSLNGYLHRAIHNNALHYLGHMAVRKNYAEQVALESREPVQEKSQYGMEMKELGNIINETLEQMPERCSRIFRMNRFEGMKYREIALLLSISVKTVEADMGKALQLFRKSLKAYISEGVS
ncbi:MAG: RNA polymerase sigma-70 factor [Bacteroidota bacterium]